MYNDIIAGLTIAGTFFTAGYIGAVWDFKKAQRKKACERKLEMAMEQYGEDIDEAIALGEQRVFDHLAEARKRSYSDNDWGMQEV
ncbi:hypothetical protein O3632_03965 [Streptococcus parasanguinis]|uniref:hypothetical protein n=1 Tax=Streptococcus parasanguinis TaxID=1318 RepID=UPI00352FD838